MRTVLHNPRRLDTLSKVNELLYRLLCALPFLPSSRRYNITVSHEKRFIWFRVAKVATRTVYHHLRESNVQLDAEHPIGIHYPTKLYSRYFKFSFVRNPWDRLVSCWHDKVVHSNYFRFSEAELAEIQTFAGFVKFVSGLDVETCDPHLRLQCRLMDLNHIDYLGRLESLNTDLSKIFYILGITLENIEARNVSFGKSHYHAYYDKALIEKVYQLYRRDIQIFDYDY